MVGNDSQRAPDDERIGFFKLDMTLEQDGYLGAMLVTDRLGKPVEFRVTYPIKPSLVQRTIYGASLLPHIGIELCGKPLYETLINKPVLLLVEEDRFLPLSEKIDGFMARVKRSRQIAQSTQEDIAETLLAHPTSRFEPVIIRWPSHYSMPIRQHALKALESFFTNNDLIEPFERIHLAVKVLAQEDTRFR
ncbi:MAG: hypothetical protein QXZ09_05065 [Candidatus Methanomethylicaceae archaeon]